MKQIITLLLACTVFAGCTEIKQRSAFVMDKQNEQFLKATARPPLKVPAPLSRHNVGNSYPIPSVMNHGPVPAPITPPKR